MSRLWYQELALNFETQPRLNNCLNIAYTKGLVPEKGNELELMTHTVFPVQWLKLYL